MTRYVALLGSINVGGNRLKMADLREALEREDFADVETVVASGNVLFSHDERPTDGLGEKLAYVVKDRFGFDTFAAVRSRDELAAARSPTIPSPATASPSRCTRCSSAEALDATGSRLLAETTQGRNAIAAGDARILRRFLRRSWDSEAGPGDAQAQAGGRATARNINSLRRILDKMG